jgi:hypothetical protein
MYVDADHHLHRVDHALLNAIVLMYVEICVYWLQNLYLYFAVHSHTPRAILCKGSRYPPTLPRPTIQILPYELPMCELTADKGTMEVRVLIGSVGYY